MLNLEKLQQTSKLPLPMQEKQKGLWSQMQNLNPPTKKSEFWKYTNKFAWLENLNRSKPEIAQSIQTAELPENISGVLYFQSGTFIPSLSTLPSGITLYSYTQNPEKFSPSKDSARNKHWDYFTKLNQASCSDYFLFEVAQDTSLVAPLIIVNNASGKELNSLHCQFRVKTKAKLTVLHLNQGETEPAESGQLGSYLWELEEGAQLEHVFIDAGNNSYHSLANIEFHLDGKNSQVSSHTFSLGGKQIRLDVRADLNAEQAHFYGRGFYGINGEAHHDLYLSVHHHKPETNSELLYKGILQDKATGVFTGHIVIDQYAQKANAELLNKNLLLGEKALIQTRPQLEVYADDVKAGHGATVGRLDEEQLFYLESRGIKKLRALELLYQGFVDDLIERIQNPTLQNYAKDFLSRQYSTEHDKELNQQKEKNV